MNNKDGPLQWGLGGSPPFEGDPFALARSSCRRAVEIARDVAIDEPALQRFAGQLDVPAIRDILQSSMGENCDTVANQFSNGDDAANFAVLFSLMQFGHGFRHELHDSCQRGASQTITLGIRALRGAGDLSAGHLRGLTGEEIYRAFQLPKTPALAVFAQQLHAVLVKAGVTLESLGLKDFAAFIQQTLRMAAAAQAPAATTVQQLAFHFGAFNDQGVLHDGSRAVLMKKATLGIGELRRLAAPHNALYAFSEDFRQAIAPVDNVIPAMLACQGVLRLSPTLHRTIHVDRTLLPRGPQEAELRAVSLAACEQIVGVVGGAFTALDLGYYLWRSGKAQGARQFSRHHTQDTVFY